MVKSDLLKTYINYTSRKSSLNLFLHIYIKRLEYGLCFYMTMTSQLRMEVSSHSHDMTVVILIISVITYNAIPSFQINSKLTSLYNKLTIFKIT